LPSLLAPFETRRDVDGASLDRAALNAFVKKVDTRLDCRFLLCPNRAVDVISSHAVEPACDIGFL
jgi:hypothetical protein